MLKRVASFLFFALLLLPVLAFAQDGWIPLFDGKTLNGWKASENQGGWKVVDGQLAFDGQRSHLFYVGAGNNADFRNFELKAEVLTRPLANSGVFFHTEYQEKGFPVQGFEVQVCNTCEGEGTYRERKRTGSLYGVRNVYKAMANDNEWFQFHVVVRGKQVQIRVNNVLVVDFVESDPAIPYTDGGRIFRHGAFALQGHDPGSKVFYKNIVMKPLPDDAPWASDQRPVVDDLYREVLRLGGANYPLVDYHTHLNRLTVDDVLAHTRRTGTFHGIAVNGGVGNRVTNDAGAEAFLKTVQGQPAFVAFQAEGREWVKMFSKETIAKFDYVFTDSMTWTDDNGRRMRLWINQEVPEITDKQAFMDMLVSRTVGILNNEAIDIYVNPTFLPDQIAAEYDQLWTPERMQKVIDAAKKNDVAIEINNRYKLPSAAFIRAARQAGVKFACGTNNAASDLGRNEYCIQMIGECRLRETDFFVPRPNGQKPVQRIGALTR